MPRGRVPSLPSRWRCLRPLGIGGQADVWLAEDLELGGSVALKVFRSELSPVARERLRREVRLGQSLQHPNLVRVYELIEAGDRMAAAMEWVEGGSVVEGATSGPVALERVVAIGEQTLDALAYLHSQGVVHRDVKPSNLLVDGNGRVRLGDLGLARSLETDHTVTRTNLAVGTTRYMSPEQIRGERAVPASDLYGLGVTLYELLTGEPPYEATSEFELARLHLHGALQDPRRLRPDCPRWFAAFVMRLMEKRPEDRFADGSAALAAFGRQRVVRSPRMRRRALLGGASVAALALLIWGGAVAAGHLRRGRTARIEAVGDVVHGLDERGRETWRYSLAEPVQRVEQVDLDGDGSMEEVVAAWNTTKDRSVRTKRSEVVITDSRGRLVTRLSPESLVPNWSYDYPMELQPAIQALDIDGDGLPEVLLRCAHADFFPALVVVYWPRRDVWQPILLHSGFISDVRVVPGSSPPRLRFCGVNNRLGMLPVVGEIVLSDQGEPGGSAATPFLQSPDVVWKRSAAARWSWYVPLAEDREPTGLSIGPDGGTTVTFASGARRLDRFGNPLPGPHAGRDITALRSWFLDRLQTLAARAQPIDAGAVRERLDEIRNGAAGLLDEPPYRAILALRGARALARVGDLEGGIRFLAETAAIVPYDDVEFRLAQLEALDGRLREPVARMRRLLSTSRSDRLYDAAHLVLRLGIEAHDPATFRSAVQRLGAGSMNPDARNTLYAALEARAHLWWDQVSAADTHVHSWSYASFGEAIACLARWRLGRTAAGDVEAMERFIERNPDAGWEGRVALGAALLGSGQATEAAASLGTAIAGFEPLSRDDFMNRQVLDLARGVYVKALLAAGERSQAVAEAHRLRPTLRDGLLPAILADEVMAEQR